MNNQQITDRREGSLIEDTPVSVTDGTSDSPGDIYKQLIF